MVEGPEEGLVVVDMKAADVEAAIAAAGTIPLPPYFHGTLDSPDRYQTMFARNTGSAAATAGLHFTPEVAAGLRQRGIEIASVDLHVGIDTFRPITADDIEHHDALGMVLDIRGDGRRHLADPGRRREVWRSEPPSCEPWRRMPREPDRGGRGRGHRPLPKAWR